MDREPGLSARLKLTLSYAGFLMVTGVILLALVWLFLLRYVPPDAMDGPGWFFPGRYDLVRAFLPRAMWAMLFLLIFGLIGGWILAGRMLAPLRRITAATRSAAAGSLSHRIGLEGRRDEFRDLADSFDAMLAKLEAHVAEQQRFAANASHELRTPLAVTQTMLDVARRDAGAVGPELLERLSEVNARAIRLTEALLLLSRADQRSFARSRVDLSLVAEEAVEGLLPLAEKYGVAVEVAGEISAVQGSEALLVQAVTNLLHNAILHNLPAEGRVRITTGAGSDAAYLVIENTGEPVTPELIATLIEPFQRGTERVRADQAGAGLGLAIVQSIVRAHDGALTLETGREGGLRVTVRLPALL
ncbi:MAG: sensor histidine kinase [Leucobacter sp.]